MRFWVGVAGNADVAFRETQEIIGVGPWKE